MVVKKKTVKKKAILAKPKSPGVKASPKKKAKRKPITKKVDEYGLSLKEREFADLYRGGHDAVRGNAKRCYMQIHPRSKERTAETEGAKLLRKPEIVAYLKVMSEEVSEECGINAKWVLNQAVAVHERCMQARPVLDRKGEPVMVRVESEDGKSEVEFVPAYTFDASGANKSLELVGRHVDVRAFEKDEVAVGLTVTIEGKDSQA